MKETWCQVKGSDNQGGVHWQLCQKCCLYCKEPCTLRICGRTQLGRNCCWRASPVEWMLGRLDDKARMFVYKLRMYEWWLRKGKRIGDGTWEGERLEEFWKEHPKEYQALYESLE